MSDFIRIICASAKPITRLEIMRFVEEGNFLSDHPIFEPRQDSTEAPEENWKRLRVHYQKGKRPIDIERDVNNEFIHVEIQEILTELVKSDIPQHLTAKLTSCHQVIAIEVDSIGLTDEAWEMLYSLESYLAQSLEGVIYDTYAFYDANLDTLYELPRT